RGNQQRGTHRRARRSDLRVRRRRVPHRTAGAASGIRLVSSARTRRTRARDRATPREKRDGGNPPDAAARIGRTIARRARTRGALARAREALWAVGRRQAVTPLDPMARWRLILGEAASSACGELAAADLSGMDAALAWLYGRDEGGRQRHQR